MRLIQCRTKLSPKPTESEIDFCKPFKQIVFFYLLEFQTILVTGIDISHQLLCPTRVWCAMHVWHRKHIQTDRPSDRRAYGHYRIWSDVDSLIPLLVFVRYRNKSAILVSHAGKARTQHSSPCSLPRSAVAESMWQHQHKVSQFCFNLVNINANTWCARRILFTHSFDSFYSCLFFSIAFAMKNLRN